MWPRDAKRLGTPGRGKLNGAVTEVMSRGRIEEEVIARAKRSGQLWGTSEAFKERTGYFLWINQRRDLKKLEK